MKTHRFVCAVLALLAFAAAPASAQTVIKMAALVPKDSDWERVLKDMGEQWKKVSGGKVSLVLYPGGVAGDDADVIRKMRLGTLQGAVLTSEGLVDLDRDVLGLQLPLAYANLDELYCTLGQLAPRYEQAMAAKGFVVLAWSDAGFVRFLSKTPVRTPDDLRAMKLFTWAGDDKYTDLWKQAGFNPVPLPAPEISSALQTGLVNALPSTPTAALLFQWYAQAKNMTDLDWAVLLGGVVVTKAAWDKVPADLRPQIQDAAREAAKRISRMSHEGNARDIDAMKKRGLNIVTITPAERQKWQQLIDQTMVKVRGNFISAEAMDAALKARDACRSKKM